MADFNRGRSSSATRSPNDISRSSSAHNAAFNPQASARGIDPSLSSLDPSFGQPHAQHLGPPPTQQQPQQQHQPASFQNSVGVLPQDLLHTDTSFDPSALNTSFDYNIPNQDFDLSLDLGTDVTQLQANPNMLGLQAQAPPQLLQHQPHLQQQHQPQQHLFLQNSLSPADSMHSPSSMHGGRHSRNQSLDPASAAFLGPHNNGDWSGMQFQGHRHTPSDGAFSDVSSQHSPFVEAANSFDGMSSNSPMMGSTDPAMMNNDFGMQQFTLSDPLSQSFHSPNHSAQPSPRMSPQQGLAMYTPIDSFGLSDYPGNQGPDVDLSPTAFPNVIQQQQQQQQQQMQQLPQQRSSRSPSTFETQMSPPEINIVTAPMDNQPAVSNGAQDNNGSDALSPPGRSRNRQRAISESGIGPSSHRGESPLHRRSPSLGLQPPESSGSRSTSPNGGGQRLHIRRASTPDRHWALDLANRGSGTGADDKETMSPFAQDPTSSVASTGTDTNRRAQKHPATFQCHLCPKRFTRAYNLRSHLRTHTDERPFVCTVCGKAFARQHDRKRHEGLHSGEKKFICKGLLQSNGGAGQQTWGCGRRFARADALGRHFRSEAGRACIKALLDEEARERRAAAMEQANQDMINGIGNGGMMGQAGQFDGNEFALDSSTFTSMSLPAALLQQYPALAEIQWNAIPGPGQDDGDMGDGRSSFDASSGGEFGFEEEDEGDGYVSGPGALDQHSGNRLSASFSQANSGWSSDYN